MPVYKQERLRLPVYRLKHKPDRFLPGKKYIHALFGISLCQILGMLEVATNWASFGEYRAHVSGGENSIR